MTQPSMEQRERSTNLGNVALASGTQALEMQNVTDVFADLRRILITEGLFERLTEQIAGTRSEAQEKAEESAALRNRHATLKPRAEARIRVLANEIDKAIAEGRDPEVCEMRAEIVGVTENLADIIRQADACDERVWELEEMQKQCARELFEEAYPEIRDALVEVQRGMCNLLDGVWDDLERYQSEAGLEGSRQPYVRSLLTPALKADLTARDRGEEGAVFRQLVQWFGVRQR